ncbi:MAG: nucleoside triphosphate pyrophosphohydrolase family protein [Firmicutes bacterium]|nr:nucleoside triphosphate pyrophosphohydrolase family protein [Bacillota bacterium]
MEIKTFEEYQYECAKTMGDHWDDMKLGLSYGTLGMVGEAGEVAEKVKKWLNNSKELDVDGIKKELGDVMWYIAALCEKLGFSMQEAAEINIKKLRKRHGESYSGFGDRSSEEAK